MGTKFAIDPVQLAAVGARISIYPPDPDSTVRINPDAFNHVLGIVVQKNMNGPSTAVLQYPAEGLSSLLPNPGDYLNNASPNTLTAFITPMSMVTIVLNRGSQEYPVFMGVVTKISEGFRRGHERVERTINIECQDFMYFLNHFAYFTLSWLGSATSILDSIGTFAGVAQIKALGAFAGAPKVIGTSFYENVVGQYLTNVQIATQDGFQSFLNFVDPRFGDYTTTSDTDGSLVFPFVPSFYAADGTWWDKFKTFFPERQYEMFFQTASELSNDSALTTIAPIPAVTPTTSANFTGIVIPQPSLGVIPEIPSVFNTGLPDSTAPGSATLSTTVSGRVSTYSMTNAFVARQVPFPYLRVSTDEAASMTQNTTNVALIEASSLTYVASAWDNLAEYIFNSSNPILDSQVEFCADEVRSFYIINPRQITNLLGASGTNGINSLLCLNIGTLFDPVALSKYGYRPDVLVTDWMSASNDTTPTSNSTPNIAQLCLSLLLTFSSIYVPQPLMASGFIKIPLSPWVLPGNKITCQAFKDSAEAWTFYIEAVEHNYYYGQESTTTLRVSRGLPVSVYGNTQLMTFMLCGLVERVNNNYVICNKNSYPILQTVNGLSIVSLSNAAYTINKILPALNVAQGA